MLYIIICIISWQVCLGFVEDLDANGVPQIINSEYVLAGQYEIDIAGIR